MLSVTRRILEDHSPENTNQWIGRWVRSLLESPKVLSLSDSKKDCSYGAGQPTGRWRRALVSVRRRRGADRDPGRFRMGRGSPRGRLPPLNLVGDDGERHGFDVDMAVALYKQQFVRWEWERLFLALREGVTDMAAASMSITEERHQSVSFRSPYYSNMSG